MADKKISDFTAATSIASSDLLELELSGGNSRKITGTNAATSFRNLAFSGAKVRKTTNLTGQNITGSPVVTFDSEDWDTDGYHSNVSNTERLVVPEAGYYIAIGQLELTGGTAGTHSQMRLDRYNSSNVFQETIAYQHFETTTSIRINASGTALFASGDYARMTIATQSDTSMDITTLSYLEIRRVG